MQLLTGHWVVNAGPVLAAVSFQPYSDSPVEKRKEWVVFNKFILFVTQVNLFSILFPIDLITLINWTKLDKYTHIHTQSTWYIILVCTCLHTHTYSIYLLLLFSRSVMSDSLRPHGLEQTQASLQAGQKVHLVKWLYCSIKFLVKMKNMSFICTYKQMNFLANPNNPTDYLQLCPYMVSYTRTRSQDSE